LATNLRREIDVRGATPQPEERARNGTIEKKKTGERISAQTAPRRARGGRGSGKKQASVPIPWAEKHLKKKKRGGFLGARNVSNEIEQGEAKPKGGGAITTESC